MAEELAGECTTYICRLAEMRGLHKLDMAMQVFWQAIGCGTDQRIPARVLPYIVFLGAYGISIAVRVSQSNADRIEHFFCQADRNFDLDPVTCGRASDILFA